MIEKFSYKTASSSIYNCLLSANNINKEVGTKFILLQSRFAASITECRKSELDGIKLMPYFEKLFTLNGNLINESTLLYRSSIIYYIIKYLIEISFETFADGSYTTCSRTWFFCSIKHFKNISQNCYKLNITLFLVYSYLLKSFILLC